MGHERQHRVPVGRHARQVADGGREPPRGDSPLIKKTGMSNVEKLRQAQLHAMSIRPSKHGFPYLAEVLRLAGVHKNYVDVAAGGALYLMNDGTVYQPGTPLHTAPVTVPGFDRAALVAAIDADKAGRARSPNSSDAAGQQASCASRSTPASEPAPTLAPTVTATSSLTRR
jgi:hypothetical protein